MIAKLRPISAALALALAGSAQAAPIDSLFTLVPTYLAPVYDPANREVQRRRPGHPPPARRVDAEDINPGAVSPPPRDAVGEFLPVPDRWRLMEALGFSYPWYDPYNQNIWKGDKPIHSGDWFLSLLGISDTVIEPRSFPLPVAPATTNDPDSIDIFGRSDTVIFAQTLLAGFVYYKGNTVFKPPDWEYRLTLGMQVNHVRADEARLLRIDPRSGDSRTTQHIGLQELFVDKHLRDLTVRYDFDSIRVGIQPFSTDFRGFLFQDNQLGVRLFGNRDNNLWQYNLAWFRRVEKDTNSGLNAWRIRDDDIFIANLYRQDWPVLGFISQGTVVHNRNREDRFHYNRNGFIERPSSLGGERTRTYDVTYFGLNGDGHFGPWNLTASAYYAYGDQSNGVFRQGNSDIRAGFFAAEGGRDFSWIRTRVSVAWASGDDDAYDDRSGGFDSIFENPIFAGSDTSYWIRQPVPLVGGGGVVVNGRNGMLNALRSTKEEGQSNFDNPGLRLIGVGADFDLTPQSRVSVNLNQLWFDDTAILEVARNQGGIKREIGQDLSVSWIWRPFMTQNVVLRVSAAGLNPGSGFATLYGDDDWHYSVLGNLILTY